MASTPVTWKRAKIPNQVYRITQSKKSKSALQSLGDALIDFCNSHALESIKVYGLEEIGYSRLVVHADNRATYFERLLCASKNPVIFNKADFQWHWPKPKQTTKKEQLQALHGTHLLTNQKWFAWHGLGENQLHFNGERYWWAEAEESHAVTFNLPASEEKLSIESFVELLSKLES